VSFLADLAGSGAALELGIGTGRIALPLSRRGVRVHGIEVSPAMVAQLQAKPDAENVGVTLGDFVIPRASGTSQARLPGGQHDHERDDAR
jgi:16S rRNA A1518/A1519 N6-dimethyltransferase RsmA/KsgA/DIM1 with predicted DNA glycosylase/AP lyase activity